MGERTELRIEEHTWKYTGNATCSGGVVGEHVANALKTQEELTTAKSESKWAYV